MGEPQLVGDGMIVDDDGDRRQTGPLITQSDQSELRRTGPFRAGIQPRYRGGELPPKSASEVEVGFQPKEGRASSLGSFWGGVSPFPLVDTEIASSLPSAVSRKTISP